MDRLETQPFDHSCFEVSKFMTGTRRHEASIPRAIDGAVNFDNLIEKLIVVFAGALRWTVGAWVNSLAKGGGKKKRFHYSLNPYSSNEILYFQAIQGHSGENFVDPSLQDYILLPDDFAECIHHIGNAYEMHSIVQSGLIPGGKSNRRDIQSVFFTAVNPMDVQPDQREVECDLDKPRIAPYKQTHLEISSQYSILVQLKACSEKRIAILSNSITCNYSFRKHYQRLYRYRGMHENKGRTLLQNVQVSQVTPRNTCAEVATRSEGCT